MSSLAIPAGPASLCGHVPVFGLTAKRVMTVEVTPVTGRRHNGSPPAAHRSNRPATSAGGGVLNRAIDPRLRTSPPPSPCPFATT